MSTPVELYFEAWQAKDPEILRPVLADDVTFDGPLAKVAGSDAWITALGGLFNATTGLTIVRRWTDGPDTLTWFDLSIGGGEPMPTVNWTHVEGGLIREVRVTFDPRPMLAT